MSRSLLRHVLIVWVLASILLLWVGARSIGHMALSDPDDAMRLNEVRDWLAGQSWWDVSQHRLWGGQFAMHWSRLVDLPLAAMLVPLTPLLGPALAAKVTLALVPLVTLLCVMLLAAALTARLTGEHEPPRLAVLLALFASPLLYQVHPGRIDHHGWQIVCALAAVFGLVSRPDRHSGAAIGLSLALLLTISLEGLPISAAILGTTMLAAILDARRRDQARFAGWTMIAALVLLHAATRGPNFLAPACDAMSPAWLLALGMVVGGFSLASLLPPRAPLWAGLAALGASGLAGLLLLATIAPICLQGPFGMLDPFVRAQWYRNILEGMPIWAQAPKVAAATMVFPVFGLVGTIAALRHAAPQDRPRWLLLLLVTLAGFVLTLSIARAGATANALAVPGGAWLLHRLLKWARTVRALLPRVLATAGVLCIAAAPLLILSLGGGTVPAGARIAGGSHGGRLRCPDDSAVAALAQLPPSTLFAPLDITPEILATTPHRAIGSGYHRNNDAIHRVMATFLASPDKARIGVLASGARYVVGCPGLGEVDFYRIRSPNGLWAQLQDGRPIPWLEPVPIHGSPVLAWRVH